MELCVLKDPPPFEAPPQDPYCGLVGLAAVGNESALEALYDATSPRVFGLALRILGDRSAAEEAVLDVYTQVWRESTRFDPARGSVLVWLLTLTRSRAIDLLRARARQAGREEGLEAAGRLPDSAPGPEESNAAGQRARIVRRALEGLPPVQRRAIAAAYFDGLTHTEIARALGEPLGTIKTRIRSGLAALRQALAVEKENLA
jgi:RNA polymerase sigma-70 factor (ECF subfamily)